MKKLLAIIALAGVFTACGNGSETSTTTDSIATDSSTMMQAPVTDTSSHMMSDSSSMMMSDSTPK